MPPRDPNLPEGTDSILDDTAGLGGTGSAGGTGAGSQFGSSSMSSTGSSGGFDDMDTLASSTGTSSGSATGGSMGSGLSGSAGGSMGSTNTGGGMDVQSLKSQASDKVRDVASQGKDKATEAMDSISRLVSETADTVDERLGPQYGNYVRKAGDALDGLNDSIRGKQVDELFDDARNLVRKSPAVAIGAAAAIGFLLVRLVKSGMPQTIDQGDDYYSGDNARLTGSAPRVDNSYDPVA